MTSAHKEAVLTPGQVVGKCEVVKLLGRGGMGQVYLANHQGLRKQVALKVLSLKSFDSGQVERFIKEAQLAASIEHPNVVTILDVDYARTIGLHYIVMQYVRGKNLAEVVREQGTLEWRRALEIIQAAAEGLAAVHRKRLIHRDIKHSNIMLTDEGRVVLMDFGLAREEASSELTRSGGVLGTPAFMSPEQGRGKKLDKSSDIFSLGGTLYYLLTDRAPFQGATVEEVMGRVAAGVMPPTVHQLNRLVPRAVSDLVVKAMEPRPEQRFADAETFAAAIGRLLQAPPPPPPPGQHTADESSLETTGEPLLTPLGPHTLATMPGYDRPRPAGGGARAVVPWLAAGALVGLCVVALLVQLGKGTAAKDGKPKSGEAASGKTEGPRREPPPGMVWIAEGDVQLGNDERAARAYAERAEGLKDKPELINQFVSGVLAEPREKRKLPGFWIDKYEVTNAEYARFLQATGHPPPRGDPDNRDPIWTGRTPPAGLENYPVVNVSHADALKYAEWAGKKLPTIAQWVRAYRGDKDWLLPWGNDWFRTRANVGENKTFTTPSPFNATPEDVSLLGVYNLVGNVDEMTRDLLDKDGKMWVVARGAHYNCAGSSYGVASFRTLYTNGAEVNKGTGFRCVIEGP